MSARLDRTPTAAELDELATVTPDDIERARTRWRAGLVRTPRRALATLLDATADADADVGPATAPLPDEA